MTNWPTKKLGKIRERVGNSLSHWAVFVKDFSVYNKVLFVLFLVNLFFIFQTHFHINDTIMNILIGSLVSFIFYFVVVYIPRYLYKENLKKVFLDYYDQFKEDILREVLHLTEFDGDVKEKINSLKDTGNFIAFYKEPRKDGQNNLHVLMNNILKEDYKHSLKIIVTQISELQREVDFIVRSVGVGNSDLLKKFRNLDRALQDGRYTENLDWNWEDDRRFVGALYELLSGWSIADGAHGDFIKTWIKQI